MKKKTKYASLSCPSPQSRKAAFATKNSVFASSFMILCDLCSYYGTGFLKSSFSVWPLLAPREQKKPVHEGPSHLLPSSQLWDFIRRGLRKEAPSWVPFFFFFTMLPIFSCINICHVYTRNYHCYVFYRHLTVVYVIYFIPTPRRKGQKEFCHVM